MPDPLSFNEKIVFLPSAYHSVLRLERHSSFDQWRLALTDAGFIEDFAGQASGSVWPAGLDPMGPAPTEPRDARRHSLMHHPDGFIVTLASGLAPQTLDGSTDESARPLATLMIYHQTNLGANIHDLRRGAFGSGGRNSLGDGVWIYTGAERMGSNPQQLAYFLAECHQEARPTPLSQWGHQFIHAEMGLFSPAPSDSAFGGPDFADLRERFTKRIQRDWSSFTAALPPEIACRVSMPGAVIPHPPGGPKRADFRYASSTVSYWAAQLAALGENWPGDRDSAIMAKWSSSIASARSEQDGLIPLAFDHASERVLGGSNPMHAVASFHTHPLDAERAVDVARRWLCSLPNEQAQQWLMQRDALGRTPVGVAFEAWMRDGALARDEPPPPRVIDLFFELGWLGAPGELGQIAHDILSEPPPSWSYQKDYGCLGHAMALDKVERCSSLFQHEWLAPIRADDGIKQTRAEALRSILGKFANASVPTRAYLEALSLRAEICPSPARSHAPRL